MSQTQAEHIIGKFGGLTALARALGHRHPTTVQGWKTRGFIPQKRHMEILQRGRAMGVDIRPEDFLTVEGNGQERCAS